MKAVALLVASFLVGCASTAPVYTCDSPGVRCGGPSWQQHPELAGQAQQQLQLDEANRKLRAMQWELTRIRAEQADR